ncbi:MAG: hypothetical protein BroJett011_41890 [Chloroflexota bacterium]|nr:MAG: hypothetical protein BroJett011_41890 [Chloroflexota bacterium]
MQNRLFGQVLTEGIHSIKARQGRDINVIEAEIAQALGYSADTVQRWRKGWVPKDETQVEFLARHIVQNGRRGRQWLDRFLTQARYYDRQQLLDELCPEQSPLAAGVKLIYHNLPPHSGEFLGRENEMAQIIEGLASRWPLISIEGMGGIGKTTLAIEVGWACLSGGSANLDVPFEACVFISAKNQTIMLNDLLNTIARVLNYPYIIQQTPPAEKPVEVDHLLRSHRVLIIADNFETVTAQPLIAYLQNIPEPSKALITTRHGQLRTVWPVSLRGLPETEALELIRRHARRLQLSTVIRATDETLKPLITVTDGNPYALVTALGYLKQGGLALDSLVNALYQAGREVGDIFNYIFGHTWQIMSQDACHLLMAMSFFSESASKTALGAAAGVEGYYLDAAIGQLVEMSLLEVNEALEEVRQRYSVHPLTLAFVGSKLLEAPEWEQAARERWSDFFVEYAELYGDDEIGGAVSHREELRDEINNIRLAIDWCFGHELTKAVRLVERISTFLLEEGEWNERLNLCRRALEVAQTPASQVGLRTRLGWTYFTQGDELKARQAWEEGLEIARQNGLHQRVAQFLRDLGWSCVLEGDYAQAHQLFTESLELAEEIEHELGILLAKAFLARTAYAMGHYREAEHDLLELLPEARKSHPRILYILRWLGEIALAEGRLDAARSYLEDGANVLKSYPDADTEARLQENLGDLEKATGHFDKAREVYDKALHLATRLGMRKEAERLEGKLQEIEQPLAKRTFN